MKNLFGENPARLLAFAGLIVGLFLLFLTIQILLVPFVAALFVAYLFEPVIVVLQRRGMDRGKAFLSLFCLTLAGIALVLMIMPSRLRLESLSGSSATFTDRLSRQLGELELWADGKFPVLTSSHIGDERSLPIS
jgi:predicted PurR-regulated permease PerM